MLMTEHNEILPLSFGMPSKVISEVWCDISNNIFENTTKSYHKQLRTASAVTWVPHSERKYLTSCFLVVRKVPFFKIFFFLLRRGLKITHFGTWELEIHVFCVRPRYSSRNIFAASITLSQFATHVKLLIFSWWLLKNVIWTVSTNKDPMERHNWGEISKVFANMFENHKTNIPRKIQ